MHVDKVTQQKVVTGPDGYKFMMVDMDEGDQKDPFLFVSLHVKNLASSLTFYDNVLDAKESKSYHGTQVILSTDHITCHANAV